MPAIHVHPTADPRGEHVTEGFECWCDPDVEWIDHETGLPLDEPIVKHNAPPGYPGATDNA